MRVVKLSIAAGALTLALSASVFGQATPPQAPPKPQTPPATTPAAQPTPKPPVPFPQDAKYAFIDVQKIASSSAAGKEASKRLQALSEKKQSEVGEKNKQLQALTTKRDTGAAVMSEAARSQLEKDIERLQREIQYAGQSAQAEIGDLQNDLQGEFQKRLIPIIEELAKEKGLYMIFTAESGFAYVHPGLDLSDEVVKRLDAKK
jgi:outer membrane protein